MAYTNIELIINLIFRAECKSPPAVKSASESRIGEIPIPTV